MANEITVEITLIAEKDAININRVISNSAITMTGTNSNGGALIVPEAAAELVPLGDVTDADKGICMINNPSTSAGDITVGLKIGGTYYPIQRVVQGGCANLVQYDPAAELWWKAVTADTTVEIILLEA